jgi:ABC-type antimicrobial peptide transport system permease subunit
MEVALFIIGLMIPVYLLNLILFQKCMSYLKSEYKNREYRFALNFAWPKKEYFYDIKGWEIWIKLQWLGFLEVIIFFIIIYLFTIQ